MSPEQFDREQAGAFLRFLDPEASRFTFQIYDDGSAKRPEMAAWFHGSLDALWGELCRLSRAGAGIFVTINETDFKGRKAGNIIRIRALFADLDGAPLANAWNVPVRLGWISKTSPGRFHAYWRVTGIELDEFKPLQKRIIELTGGDPAIHDLPRVMRLPGFCHQKSEPYLAEGMALESTVNSRDAVIAALPLPPPKPPPTPRAAPFPGLIMGNGAGGRRYALAALDSEVEKVANAPRGERNHTLNVAAFNLGTLLPHGEIDQGEVEDALTDAALRAGLSSNEIEATIRSGINAGMSNPRAALCRDERFEEARDYAPIH
jgi:DNA primase RepB-like protein